MKLKYYLRGIGLGIIFATIIMAIGHHNHPLKMSDAEVMERAKALGMVKNSESDNASQIPVNTEKDTQMQGVPKEGTEQAGELQEDLPGNTETVPDEPQMENQPASQEEGSEQTQNPTGPSVEFQIIRGDSSNAVAQRLELNHLVESAEEFNEYLLKNGYANEILPGTYQIPAGADYETIAKMFVKPQ